MLVRNAGRPTQTAVDVATKHNNNNNNNNTTFVKDK